MKPIYWTIILLATLAVCASAVYYVVQPNQDFGPIVFYHKVKNIQSQSPTSTDVSISDLKDWKTINISDISFSYPNSFQQIQDFGKEGLYKNFNFSADTKIPKTDMCFQSADINTPQSTEELPCTLYVQSGNLNGALENYILKNENLTTIQNVQAYKQLTFGGNNGILVGTDGPGIGNWEVFMSQNGKVYIFTVTNLMNADGSSLSNQAVKILSSIKFNSNNLDVSAWKTYTSSEYGFEFKYPLDFVFDEKNSILKNKNIEIYLSVGSSNLKQSEQSGMGESDPPFVNINIANYTWQKSDLGDIGGGDVNYSTENKDKKIIVTFNIAQGSSLSTTDQNLVNEILSTFKFKK